MYFITILYRGTRILISRYDISVMARLYWYLCFIVFVHCLLWNHDIMMMFSSSCIQTLLYIDGQSSYRWFIWRWQSFISKCFLIQHLGWWGCRPREKTFRSYGWFTVRFNGNGRLRSNFASPIPLWSHLCHSWKTAQPNTSTDSKRLSLVFALSFLQRWNQPKFWMCKLPW